MSLFASPTAKDQASLASSPATMTRVSPASSPRLPSPPPIAEDQLGPKSPSPAGTEEHGQLRLGGSPDTGARRRIRPGTKAEDMAEGPPLIPLNEIDSAFQLTEHLKALHYSFTHPLDSDKYVPLDRASSLRLAEPPESVDKHMWLFELCRFLTQKANTIVVALFADDPACSAMTCPEMRASEWQYLCAVHDPPKSCSALDYCCHTLDWAANTLTSPKNFPSRLALFSDDSNPTSGGGGGANNLSNSTVAGQQIRHLTNIFRRVYRIFAHAWFSHRRMFWQVENSTGLYVFFKTVCDSYNLIPADNYTIPNEAEGIPSTSVPAETITQSKPLSSLDEDQSPQALQSVPTILRRPGSGPMERTNSAEAVNESALGSSMLGSSLAPGSGAKHHRGSPSVTSVATVIEEPEDEEESSAEIGEIVVSKPDGEGKGVTETPSSVLPGHSEPALTQPSRTETILPIRSKDAEESQSGGTKEPVADPEEIKAVDEDLTTDKPEQTELPSQSFDSEPSSSNVDDLLKQRDEKTGDEAETEAEQIGIEDTSDSKQEKARSGKALDVPTQKTDVEG